MKFKKLKNKWEAKKLWAQGETIWLLSCNLRPSMIWHPCPVKMENYVDDAERYKAYHDEAEQDRDAWYAKQYAHLWKGSLEETAWDLMYNNWFFYNTDSERGRYAHYYVIEEDWNE